MSEETTEGMDFGDTLITVGTWFKQGRIVERQSLINEQFGWHPVKAGCGIIPPQYSVYRAKPRKPRSGMIVVIAPGNSQITTSVSAIELTPEVRAVLEREGLFP